jgi:hypothetical protein
MAHPPHTSAPVRKTCPCNRTSHVGTAVWSKGKYIRVWSNVSHSSFSARHLRWSARFIFSNRIFLLQKLLRGLQAQCLICMVGRESMPIVDLTGKRENNRRTMNQHSVDHCKGVRSSSEKGVRCRVIKIMFEHLNSDENRVACLGSCIIRDNLKVKKLVNTLVTPKS